jgi:ribonuclease Z
MILSYRHQYDSDITINSTVATGAKRMKLHCLGTAGYHPSATRHTSCYFLPEAKLMLDAGSGLFRGEPLFQANDLSILLSHAHLDHTMGLTFLLDYLAVTPLKIVRVYGEGAKLDAIRSHLFHEALFPVLPPIEWRALENESQSFSIGDTRCSWFPMDHPGGSVGFRLSWKGLSFAYITDTTATPNADYWAQIQGVDWVLHECNFSDEWVELAIKTGHSWTTGVLESAAIAGVSRLILSHVNPLADDHDPLKLDLALSKLTKMPPKKLLLARDSMVIDLSSL